MAFLTILEPSREARAHAGPRGHESAANRPGLTARHDPRVDMRGRTDVRVTFARDVCSGDNVASRAGPWRPIRQNEPTARSAPTPQGLADAALRWADERSSTQAARCVTDRGTGHTLPCVSPQREADCVGDVCHSMDHPSPEYRVDTTVRLVRQRIGASSAVRRSRSRSRESTADRPATITASRRSPRDARPGRLRQSRTNQDA